MNHRKWGRDGEGVNNSLLMSVIVKNRGSIWTLILSLSVRAATRQKERSHNGKRQNVNSDWRQHLWVVVLDVIIVKTLFRWSHSSNRMMTSLISTWNDLGCLYHSLGTISFTLVIVFGTLWQIIAFFFFFSHQGSQWKTVFEIVNNFQVLNNKRLMLSLTPLFAQDN